MAWRPIAQSGVPFTFLGGDAEISGSTVTAPFSVTPGWEIQLDGGAADYSVRVTMQAYQSTMQFEEEPSAFTFTTVGDVETVVTNLNEGTTSAFSPNPVIGTGYRVVYTPGIGSETSRSESYTMLVELDVVSVPTIKPILQTFRGYHGADSAFRTWVRTDEGRADLSAATVTVRVYGYDSRTMQLELSATADALGMVEFTLPQGSAERQLPGNLYRLELVVAAGGGVQLAQLGILELVG